MKRILIIFILSVFSFAATPPIGVFRQSHAVFNINSAAFASNVVSGDLLVAVMEWGSGGTPPTISDTLGSSWSVPLHSSNTNDLFVWYASANGSGPDTVTLSSTGGNQTFSIQEFNIYTTTVDGTPAISGAGIGQGQFSAGSVTTTTNGALLLCISSAGGFYDSFGPDNNYFVSAIQSFGGAHMVSYAIADTIGANSCSYWKNNTFGSTSILLAFKPPSGITILTSALPDGATSVPYGYKLNAIGGTSSYTWTITIGSLFTGMSLASNGLISGTPSTGGTNSITFHVTDGTSSKNVSLNLEIGASLNTPAIVQITSTGARATFATFSSNVTAKSIILADIVTIGGIRTFQVPNCVSDTRGTQFQYISSGSYPENYTSAGFSQTFIVAGVVPTSGPDTLDWSSCAGQGGSIIEISGAQLFTDIIGNQTSINTSPMSISLTTLVPNQLIHAFGSGYGTDTNINPVAPLITIDGMHNVIGIGTWNIASKLEATAGTYTPSFTFTNGSNVISGVELAAQAFRPSLATPFGPPTAVPRHGPTQIF